MHGIANKGDSCLDAGGQEVCEVRVGNKGFSFSKILVGTFLGLLSLHHKVELNPRLHGLLADGRLRNPAVSVTRGDVCLRA